MAGHLPNQDGIKRQYLEGDDNSTPAQKRLRDRAGPSRKTSLSKEGGPATIISRLFHGTTELWLLVLREQSWPFTFNPAPLETTKSEDHPDQNSNNRENFWDEARLQLGEERDRLCLWKVGVADRDIDGLLESWSDTHRQLGKAILGALLRLAVSISTSVDLHKDTPLLQKSAQKLDQVITEARNATSDNPREHSSPELATPTQLLARLQSDVAKLSKLSLQIKLATANKT
ncbi:hypothetical protein O1611_g5347 [Lasiodiplodia mahajangana]|uniref:Uncharacterized protein n=1 Tax=Lasiodiplodia mahajangana TaxID=1108764 RepID=A0ACC2JLB3_9PEZI|nr:hypothetical protein O1611_g5347 [Lasiodiplodia mahajangana]